MPGMAAMPGMLPSQPPPPPTPPPTEALAEWQKQMVEAGEGEAPPPPPPADSSSLTLDPSVRKLCDHFEIEADCAKKLDEMMANRQDTKESDLAPPPPPPA